MEISEFGERLACGSGIESLMDDLGHALAEGSGKIHMLGGGNPALIPEVLDCWRNRMHNLLQDPNRFDRMMAVYDPPKGNSRFCSAVAELFKKQFGWDLGPENIAVTGGGQTAFFFLFNLLAGHFSNGKSKRVLLPVVPEYIGYANQGLGTNFFDCRSPAIDFPDGQTFKYRIDFDSLDVGPDIGAICVSRPTNPSGNVLSDEEVARLDAAARSAGVPLIIDNAYGAPFPGIVFREIQPIWNENIVHTFSLSKLGLPGTRTGIVVARPELIQAVVSMTSVTGLANGTIGQAIVTPLIESGELLELIQSVIRPFYERKAKHAVDCFHKYFAGRNDCFIHRNDGAMFLWLWFPELPIRAAELYQRLKARGVLVVPGHYFAFGNTEAIEHCSKCLRLSFAMSDEDVDEGIRILADEVAALR